MSGTVRVGEIEQWISFPKNLKRTSGIRFQEYSENSVSEDRSRWTGGRGETVLYPSSSKLQEDHKNNYYCIQLTRQALFVQPLPGPALSLSHPYPTNMVSPLEFIASWLRRAVCFNNKKKRKSTSHNVSVRSS